jgi:hypothetical protein
VLARLPVDEWRLSARPDLDALYLALLLCQASPEQAESALARLCPDRVAWQAVKEAISLRLERTFFVRPGRPSEVVAMLDGMSEAGVVAAYVVCAEARETIGLYLSRWRFITAELNGHDLTALGLEPGPAYKRLLWELRAARLDGAVTDRAGEEALLHKLRYDSSHGNS